MLKLGMILIGFWSFFICGFHEAEGAEWKLFQASPTGNIYYYDPTEVKRFSNNFLWVWVRIIETAGLSKGDLKGLQDPGSTADVIEKAKEKSTGEWKQLFEINCSEGMARVLSAILYNRDGSIKDEYKLPSEWVSIPPDSVTNHLKKMICP